MRSGDTLRHRWISRGFQACDVAAASIRDELVRNVLSAGGCPVMVDGEGTDAVAVYDGSQPVQRTAQIVPRPSAGEPNGRDAENQPEKAFKTGRTARAPLSSCQIQQQCDDDTGVMSAVL